MNRVSGLALLGGVALGAIIGVAVFFGLPRPQTRLPASTGDATVSIAGLALGGSAPQFALETPDGEIHSTAEMLGDVTVSIRHGRHHDGDVV